MMRLGISKVGLASTEAPAVVKPAQSFNHVGLWRLGTPQKLLGHTMFKCRGRIMSNIGSIMKVQGFMLRAVKALHRVTGTKFSPDSRMYMKVKGNLALPMKSLHHAVGNIRQTMISMHTVVGTLGYGAIFVHKVTAVCKANHHTIMKHIGILRQSSAHYVKATGTLLANATSRMSVAGVVSIGVTGLMKCKGLLGYGYVATMRCQGVLQQAYNAIHRVIGGLANTKKHSFFRIVGKVNIAAFIAEVPKRTQEFITNKRWF